MADCPPREQIEQLLNEMLSENDTTRLETHIEHCRTCQATLHNLTRGAAGRSSLLSGATVPAGIESDRDTEDFFARLKQMKPSEVAGNQVLPDESDQAPINAVEIDGYEILGELGRGATGVVYRARHLKLNRLVALKVIVAGQYLSADLRQRFRLEAQTIARLRHPNIVQVYDVGEQGNCPYLSLELVEGGNLADWTGGKPRPAAEAARIIAALAKAVGYAHGQGVVHRDLKPANVLLSSVPDRPHKRELKITDFGIAKLLPQPGKTPVPMTQAGEILGTPAYMSPEQARGNATEISPATDVYSLGAMLYELLTGRPPFLGATPLETLLQAARQDPVPVRRLVPGVPADLDTICLKCLDRDPSKRYPTATEVTTDLGRFLRNERIHARPLSWTGQGLRWTRRHPGVAASLSGVIFLLALLVIGSLLATAYFRTLEKTQRTLADEREIERGKAVLAEQREGELRQQAETVSRQLRQALYFDQMNLAGQAALSPSGIGRIVERLAPSEWGQPDQRNWEWFYLNGLCHREAASLLGHFYGVLDVSWSPDGKRLASAGSDASLRIWDVASGRQTHVLKHGVRSITRAVWSADGQRIAGPSYDGTVCVWKADTGELLATFAGHKSAVLSLTWSPDGNRIASSSQDREILIWDSRSGVVQNAINGHPDQVLDVAWSPDGKRLASASADTTVRIWNAESGAELLVMRGHINFVTRVVWSADGTHLASSSNDGTAIIWKPESGEQVTTLRGHAGAVCDIAWSPDGTRIATSSEDQTIRIWPATGGSELATLRGHTQRVLSVAWSPDGTRLASAADDANVKIWNLPAEPEVPVLPGHTQPVDAVAWSPDGRRLASCSTDATIVISDVARKQTLFTLSGHTARINAVVWSPDGAQLASAGDDHTIRLWDASNGHALTVIHVSDDSVLSLAWNPDSRQLASGGTDPMIHIWDPASGKELQRCAGHIALVRALAWNPKSNRLASGSADQEIKIWDPETGAQLDSVNLFSSDIRSLAWSKDGERLASGGTDQTIRVWKPNSTRKMLTLRGHTTSVAGVCWNSDGTRLASIGDHTIKIWDADTGGETITLLCGPSVENAIAWSPDGYSIATGEEDGGVRIHDALGGYRAALAPQLLPLINQRLINDPNSAEDRQLRAEIETRAGHWAGAAADLQPLLESTPQKQWFTSRYWVSGPYSDDLQVPFGPENNLGQPDPVFEAADATTSQSDRWQYVQPSADGFVDLGKIIGHLDHASAYAFLRVYSPSRQQVALLVGADDQVRVWFNGKLVRENLSQGDAVPDADAVLVTLHPGWNNVLSRVVNVAGPHALYLRLSNAPADIARASDAADKQP